MTKVADNPDVQPEPDNNTGLEPDRVIVPPDSETALKWLAALSANAIDYRVSRGHSGWEIHVAPALERRATEELIAYERANTNWPPPPQETGTLLQRQRTAIFASTLIAGALLLLYAWTGPVSATHWLAQAGAADARAITAGQWWRAITALTLHADLTHVLANALCMILFGAAVCQLTGPGLGWFLIMLAGFGGNLAGPLLTNLDKIGIGASTASFGALGLLSVYQFYRHYRRLPDLTSIWHGAWIAAAAGIALLALLGTGPGTDITAHLFGFVSGCILAVVTLPLLHKRIPDWLQPLIFGLTLFIILAAWRIAVA
jgi:membrane associated rhomboid family serine protease